MSGRVEIFAISPVIKPNISTKSNEINAIKEILKTLDLRDTIITIDSIGTQIEIAKAVVEKEDDYILQVKDNQN